MHVLTALALLTALLHAVDASEGRGSAKGAGRGAGRGPSWMRGGAGRGAAGRGVAGVGRGGRGHAAARNATALLAKNSPAMQMRVRAAAARAHGGRGGGGGRGTPWTSPRLNDLAGQSVPTLPAHLHPPAAEVPRSTWPPRVRLGRSNLSRHDFSGGKAFDFGQCNNMFKQSGASGFTTFETVGTPGRAGQVLLQRGTLFFTHMRRTSGTALEFCYLLPVVGTLLGLEPSKWHQITHLTSSNKAKGAYRDAAINCGEGGIGRHGSPQLTLQQRGEIADRVERTLFVFRHCAFGLHAFSSRPTTYITLLRLPEQRLISWAQMCAHPSTSHCMQNLAGSGGDWLCKMEGNGTLVCGRGESELTKMRVSFPTAFYNARDNWRATRGLVLPPVDLSAQFLSNRLEILLDDNYHTRMLCGGTVHEQEAPVGLEELRCAERSLLHHYSYVGLLEQYEASLCLLQHELGIRPTNGHFSTKKIRLYPVPDDFRLAHGRKYAMDTPLYRMAERLFLARLREHPDCEQLLPRAERSRMEAAELRMLRKEEAEASAAAAAAASSLSSAEEPAAEEPAAAEERSRGVPDEERPMANVTAEPR